MRRWRVVLLAGAGLLGTAALIIWLGQRILPSQVLSPFAGGIKDTQQSLVFVLHPQRWTTFDLAAPDGRVRLVVNAGLDPQQVEAALREATVQQRLPEIDLPYALEYRITGRDEQVIKSGIYHQRARLSLIVDPASGAWTPVARYRETVGRQPASAQAIHLDLGQGLGPLSLSLRIASATAGVEDVAVRVYQREALSEEEAARQWLRLSSSQRDALASNLIYPAYLLQPGEIVNLMRNRWRPVGPSGARGSDYRDRRLYVLESEAIEFVREPTLPAGRLADAQRPAVVAIPPHPGEVILQLSTLQPVAAEGIRARLRWYGENHWQTQEQTLRFSGEPLRWRGVLPPGLIEVWPEQPAALRAFLPEVAPALQALPGRTAELPGLEITGEPIYLRTHRLAPASLDYRIDHLDGSPTAWRIDARCADSSSAPVPCQRRLRYQLLDGAGQVIEAGERALELLPAIHDRLSATPIEGWTSEAQRLFFSLSPAVRTLRLSADQPLWIAAYTRPEDVPVRRELPRDGHLWSQDEARLPSWFLTPPLASEAALAPETLLLALQPRPPERPAPAAGDRGEWTPYTPEQPWRGHFLLIADEPDRPLDAAAASLVFSALPRGRTVTLETTADPAAASVPATLALLREGGAAEPLRYTVRVNDLPLQGVTRANPALLPLPALGPGRHRLQVEAPASTRVFLNGRPLASGARYLRRLAPTLAAGQRLRYRFDKPDAEPLAVSAQLFVAPGARSVVRWRWRGLNRPQNQPLPDWTLADRETVLVGASEVGAYRFDAGPAVLAGGQRVFLPLGGELPPGGYELELEVSEGSPVYAVVYSTAERRPPTRRLLRVREDEVAGP